MCPVTIAALDRPQDHALQVRRLRCVEERWMVGGLSAFLDDLELPARIECSAPDDADEVARRERARARARDEDSAGLQHFDRAKVDLFIAACRRFQRRLAACERRRVQDDLPERLAGIARIAKIREAIGIDDFLFRKAVERHVLTRKATGVRGDVDGGDSARAGEA